MKYGYARVSTAGQNLQGQIADLKAHGVDEQNIFKEQRTGTKRTGRKELENLMDRLRDGDEVYITKIDRLARSIIDLKNIVESLNKRGVSVHFIKDNLNFTTDKKNAVDSLIFNILGTFSEFERDLIVDRTSEGRERARKQGKHLGRPSRPKKDIEQAIQLYEKRETNMLSVNDIVKMTSVPRATIYRELKKKKEQTS